MIDAAAIFSPVAVALATLATHVATRGRSATRRVVFALACAALMLTGHDAQCRGIRIGVLAFEAATHAPSVQRAMWVASLATAVGMTDVLWCVAHACHLDGGTSPFESDASYELPHGFA